ncbi:hypothetical protein JV173_01465 [Acholeplasma equirhinis]|uniref:hypothetical protein n=1 Tax=Acholeplasma equirhinis TaxID=555393 RepID=UPI00197ACCB9|nr:hypothetical protein [Acholeplasma equirhinis]MBN3490172.1 hypothetical protein [Acholeplasma equirhinis]
MKKLLSFLMLATASFGLLLTSIQSVYATTEDDYYDLFYEEIVLEFEITTFSDGIGTTDIDVYTWISENMTFDEFGNMDQPFSLTVNDVDEPANIISHEGYYAIGGADYNAMIKPGSVIEDDGSPTSLLVGDVWRYTLRLSKSWTQSYSYGRFRSETPGLDLWHDTTNGAVYLVNEGQTSGKLDLTQFDLENDESFKVVFQAPYKDFKVSRSANIYAKSNVAIVEIEFTKIAGLSPYKMSVDAYYWDGGEVKLHTGGKNENLTTAQSSNLQVQFHGGLVPAISSSENFIANVDNLTPLEDFLQYITAWDDIYGDISDQVYIDDDGGYEPDVVGVYDVTFAVEDSEGNISYLEASIHVVDIEAPVITGTTTPVTISYHEEFNVTSWVAGLSVSDNYYTGLTISIQTNTYSANKTTVGSYSITVKSTDGSGNVGTLTRNITVVDGVGPVFTGVSTITASINENLTVDQIKAALAAIDAKDGNVSASITVDSDDLTGNETTPGEYTVIFKAEDSAGNQTFHEVEVTIVSSPPGFFVVDGASVRLLPGATLTIEQILAVLEITDDYENVSTNYQAGVPGVYTLSLNHMGIPKTYSITVLGVNDPQLPIPVIPEEPASNDTWVYLLVTTFVVLTLAVYFVTKKK